KPCLRIARKIFGVLDDPAGVLAHRRGALERVALLLGDWHEAKRRCADTEARMLAVLDALALTTSVTSIRGLSALGAATILAETGDLRRFDSARAVVKHAGLAPRQKSSGAFTGRTRVTGQGRPSLRLAAWRGGWGVLQNNPVYAARYQHLTGREHNKLTATQAQAAIAAALLRPLHAVVTTGRVWDPDIAAHGSRRNPGLTWPPERHHRFLVRLTCEEEGRGEPHAALRHLRDDLADHHGQPRPSSHQPDRTLLGPNPHHRYAGTDDGARHRPNPLDAQRLTLMVGPSALWAARSGGSRLSAASERGRSGVMT
ncbi:MAG TPA: transposase, partial [Actinomycetales bacterium]|nr:transposase [Actinomycetales bacterium]